MMPYSLRLSKGWEKVAFLPAGYTSLLQVICPRRPTCTGNHQAADGCRLHGNCTPPRISPSCPHCVICGWTGVPLYPFPVMAAPGATRFLQAAVTRSYGTGLYARPIMIIRWDLLIMSVYHGAAPESAFAPRTEKGDVTDE